MLQRSALLVLSLGLLPAFGCADFGGSAQMDQRIAALEREIAELKQGGSGSETPAVSTAPAPAPQAVSPAPAPQAVAAAATPDPPAATAAPGAPQTPGAPQA